MSRTFNHMTYDQRLHIKKMLDEGYGKTQIASALGFHHSAIYREIERGSKGGQYDPNYAESRYKLLHKGREPILSVNLELARHISKLILEENLSPAKIAKLLQYDDRYKSFSISKTTIYSAIDKGFIPQVTRDSLHTDTTTMFNGQIHIAKWVRKSLSIADGDELHFEVVDDKLIFTKIIDK